MMMDFYDVALKLYPQRANGVEEDKIPWSDPNYVFEVKYDGDRRLLYILDSGNTNTSRSKGSETGLPVEKKDQVPHIRDLHLPYLNGTILDCEFTHKLGFQEGVRKIMGCLPEKAVERQKELGWIEVRIFDIICIRGEFVDHKTFEQRHELLENIYKSFFYDNPYFQLVERCHGTKEELEQKLIEIIADGGEGMVAKHKNSNYRLSTKKCESPLKNAWVKVKREYDGDFVVMGYEQPTMIFEGTTNLADWPYWEQQGARQIPVTKNYAMGWIGGIIYGDYKNGVLTKAGVVGSSSLNEQMRSEVSANKQEYLGKVMKINGMSRDKKEGTVRHATFNYWRDDKAPEDCIYELQKG
jgi:hypothetical protein